MTVLTPLQQRGELHLGPHRLDKHSNLQHVGSRLGNMLRGQAKQKEQISLTSP